MTKQKISKENSKVMKNYLQCSKFHPIPDHLYVVTVSYIHKRRINRKKFMEIFILLLQIPQSTFMLNLQSVVLKLCDAAHCVVRDAQVCLEIVLKLINKIQVYISVT
jgi:hypothetical protein